MMTIEEAAAEIGGLVEYHHERSQEFGLIHRVDGVAVFVRFHLGDTAAKCDPARLTLRVHAEVAS